jgi:biopolymer transport protein ExbD
MKSRPRRSSRWTHQPDINLNAFLDLILNVLLFFVFATELAVFDAMDVEVPVSEYSETHATQQQALMIFITKDNQYLVDGKNIAFADLSNLLSWKRTQDKSIDNVIVRGDLNSDLQAMVDVLGACRKAGIDKVKIETVKP